MLREKIDYSFDQVKNILLDYNVKTVVFGGAEPALQKKELLTMIKLMNKAGKEVVLKSTDTAVRQQVHPRGQGPAG